MIAKVSAARRATFETYLIDTMDAWMPTVRQLVASRLASKSLLSRPPRRLPEDRLTTLIAGIWLADPEQTVRDIAGRLERLHERTPRGAARWSASSVQNLLDRAQSIGLIPDTRSR